MDRKAGWTGRDARLVSTKALIAAVDAVGKSRAVPLQMVGDLATFAKRDATVVIRATLPGGTGEIVASQPTGEDDSFALLVCAELGGPADLWEALVDTGDALAARLGLRFSTDPAELARRSRHLEKVTVHSVKVELDSDEENSAIRVQFDFLQGGFRIDDGQGTAEAVAAAAQWAASHALPGGSRATRKDLGDWLADRLVPALEQDAESMWIRVGRFEVLVWLFDDHVELSCELEGYLPQDPVRALELSGRLRSGGLTLDKDGVFFFRARRSRSALSKEALLTMCEEVEKDLELIEQDGAGEGVLDWLRPHFQVAPENEVVDEYWSVDTVDYSFTLQLDETSVRVNAVVNGLNAHEQSRALTLAASLRAGRLVVDEDGDVCLRARRRREGLTRAALLAFVRDISDDLLRLEDSGPDHERGVGDNPWASSGPSDERIEEWLEAEYEISPVEGWPAHLYLHWGDDLVTIDRCPTFVRLRISPYAASVEGALTRNADMTTAHFCLNEEGDVSLRAQCAREGLTRTAFLTMVSGYLEELDAILEHADDGAVEAEDDDEPDEDDGEDEDEPDEGGHT